MRLPLSAARWAGLMCVSAALLLRCGSSQTEVPIGPGYDAESLVPPDGGTIIFDAPPESTACDDAGACLSGFAVPGTFVNEPVELRATLYAGFPVAVGSGIASEKVALDTTWAFDGLEAGTHYFVEFDPGYQDATTPAEQTGLPTVTGPFALPSDASTGISVRANPAALTVFEQGSVGGAMMVDGVLARVDEPTAGGSNVSVEIGDASVPVPYDLTQAEYKLQLPSPRAAQAAYTITTASADGSAPVAWALASSPPTTAGTVITPALGATVPANQDLAVAWTVGPEADYVSFVLFASGDAGYTSVFSVPSVPIDTTIVSVPAAMLPPGSYLLNVGFVRAYCPPDRDGCVHSSRVVTQPLTAQ
jgi:hypothetical protein